MTKEFILHDFNLPNHSNELSKANDVIEKQKKAVDKCMKFQTIDDDTFIALYEEIVRALDYVGRLSMPVFAIENEMEEMYIKLHPHSPELAKRLWLDNYSKIHHPYSLLKNRCFTLLDNLDELYINIHKKNPPNWNI